MRLLHPTSRDAMVDRSGRPYFLWDVDVTLERFEEMVRDADEPTWCYLVGKLMRQARPDDVFEFVTRTEIRERWDGLERYLGSSRPFWAWLLEAWESVDDG